MNWPAASAQASSLPSRTRLSGALAVLPQGAVDLGAVPPSTALHVDVALAPRDPAALQAFVSEVTTPGSPEFGHYLARGQFGARFGAAPSTEAAVSQWLRSEGLTVGAPAPDGLTIPVSGQASTLAAAFATTLETTRLADGTLERRFTAGPAVPSSLAPNIQGLVGLASVPRLHDELRLLAAPHQVGGQASPRLRSATSGAVPTASPCTAASEVVGGHTEDQLASAYGLASLYSQGRVGFGRTIALYELEPFSPTDVASFESCFGITTQINTIDVDGGAGTTQQSGEAAMDVEVAAALAPGSTIDVYTGPNNGTTGPYDTYQRIFDDDSAQEVSTSWGICEAALGATNQAAEETLFAQAAVQGQAVYAAAGDDGSSDCYGLDVSSPDALAVDDPASQPDVIGVGGTSLTGVATDAPTESVWNEGASGGAGGGGVSATFSRPSWQSALHVCGTTGTSVCSGRQVPDVSASANDVDGDTIVFQGEWLKAGGTSAAAPVWAALAADETQGCAAPTADVSPLLASAAAAGGVGDVTSGNNDLLGQFIPPRYASTVGYDLASGWGSPRAPALLATYTGSSAGCPTVTSLSATSGPAAGGGTVTIVGTGFGSGVPAVTFGSTPATVVSHSAVAITVTVPALPGNTEEPVVVTTSGSSAGSSPVTSSTTYFAIGAPTGYWMVASDGGIFTEGDASFFGSAGALPLKEPVVGMASTQDHQGYWLVASDGGIFTYGDAAFYGSTGAMSLNRPIVGMAATPDGKGYWLVASDGGIFTFGDAGFYGSTGAMSLNRPIVGMAATPDGKGYWLVASDGGIFTFGDAGFYGSTGAIALKRPIVGMAATPDGKGYWLVASDGGIFTFGDAGFYGSAGNLSLVQPIVAMAPTGDGHGYWLFAADGGVFTYGDAVFDGSLGDLRLVRPVVGATSG